VEAAQAEQVPDRQAANRHHEPWAEEPELPVPPERAERLLEWGRRAVAATRRGVAGIATRHRGAVEGAVERILVELEPASQRLSGAAAPGSTLLPLDRARRLPEQIRALPSLPLEDGPRLERIAGFGARAAARVVPLQGGQ